MTPRPIARALALTALSALIALALAPPSPVAAMPLSPAVTATVETAPVYSNGDAADDPAIWVNPASPDKSLVIGNDKGGKSKTGSLNVYDLSGALLQRISSPSGFWGNVDVRQNYVAVAHSGILVYRVNPAALDSTPVAAPLSPARESTGNAATAGEGICMYDAGLPGVDPLPTDGVDDGLYAINVNQAYGRVRVHPLTDADADGLLTVGKPVRDFTVGSEAEGCVVDDASGMLYVSEEDVAIWRYDLKAAGTGAPPRVMVGAVGEDLAPDAEGLALAGGYLYASAQNVAAPTANWINVYDVSQEPPSLVRSVRVGAGSIADGCEQTDGLAADARALGPAFPLGLLVCQDGMNTAPGSAGRQDFKLVPLDAVAPPPPPPPPPPGS
jgi:myo-inositol-hexaphosphate 3-phosphohydrolase